MGLDEALSRRDGERFPVIVATAQGEGIQAVHHRHATDSHGEITAARDLAERSGDKAGV